MKVVYEPAGKAREYSELAVNLYNGCSHGCVYCYAPNCLKKSIESFGNVSERNNILSKLNRDAFDMMKSKDDRQILLCFTCDPYQHLENRLKITSKAIDILIKFNLRFTILTKGGLRSIPDMIKYKDYNKASYGVTLYTLNDNARKLYEPNAASIDDRITGLKTAKDLGIKTWVSVEPVINPNETLYMIEEISDLVDKFKVGKINNYPKIENNINWKKFKSEVIILLNKLKKDYYIKKDLMKF